MLRMKERALGKPSPKERAPRARWRILPALLCGFIMMFAGSVSAGTLDDVRRRGTLTCGVSTGLYGFSIRDAAGAWSGFDVDFCRAMAAAIFNDPAKVTFLPLSAAERFDVLKQGKVDIL